jgi:hypothetical protein
MIRITRDATFGFNVKAPGQPAVWCATRAIAADTAWSLAERTRAVPAASWRSSLADLQRASVALATQVNRFDSQLLAQLGEG